eukprot:NODE_277_length_11973_cov_0.221895.p11 type:complete len:112 gc:universal NODE_277_length_11973_cov_0.221895:1382-1717(+)
MTPDILLFPNFKTLRLVGIEGSPPEIEFVLRSKLSILLGNPGIVPPILLLESVSDRNTSEKDGIEPVKRLLEALKLMIFDNDGSPPVNKLFDTSTVTKLEGNSGKAPDNLL